MDNREKARILADRLYPSTRKIEEFVEMLEAELNRLDAPEPKKWEPRGGEWYLNQDNSVCRGVSPTSVRMAGRAYRTKDEAERAAKLHRMLDRLVNWLVEHCGEDIGIGIFSHPTTGGVSVSFFGTTVGEKLMEAIESGEVEL